MLGVIADAADHEVVSEFFELFKTPWEFFREKQEYDVLLCAGDQETTSTAKLVVIYSGTKTYFDKERRVRSSHERKTSYFLSDNSDRIPIYGNTVTFENEHGVLLKESESQQCAAYTEKGIDGTSWARIGYDLFHEIRTLLTDGQPPGNASIPTLELHITLLRKLITGCGISLIEIPPVPEGFEFIACLTHDVDHPSIRFHKCDHTMFGFMYRATLGSFRQFIYGQISLQDLLKNWSAVLKLPFVYMGLAKDFWCEFADLYRLFEQEFQSTFFIIPFKNRAGIAANGSAPSFRASAYAAQDIGDIISRLTSDGHEVGLHGIDAWADSSKGREELEEIQRLTGDSETGVRMHWLYYDQNAPKTLEKAGANYDSTFGYNEAVGYRAGTTQVYKPLQATKLLELPLHVMDTALFYPSRLELSQKQAAVVLEQIQDNAARFGGVLTVNWHDRSLAPERLWDTPYRNLLASIKNRGAWFATARQTVSWFRKRRSARFELNDVDRNKWHVRVDAGHGANLPSLRLRTYAGCLLPGLNSRRHFDYVETIIYENAENQGAVGMIRE